MAKHGAHFTMEGLSKMSSRSGNSVHGPFDLSALESTNTHIVEATTCTYESTRTFPGEGPMILWVGELPNYMDLFHSREGIEARITLANGDPVLDDGAANLIPGDNFAHSLFSSITLELNEMEVSNTSSCAEHAYIDALLNTTSVEKTTISFAEG